MKSSRVKWLFSLLGLLTGLTAIVAWHRGFGRPTLPTVTSISPAVDVSLSQTAISPKTQPAKPFTGIGQWGLVTAAGGCMVFSAVNFYPFVAENEWKGVFFALLGGILLVVASRWRPQVKSAISPPSDTPAHFTVPHLLIAFMGAVGILLVSESNGDLMGIPWLKRMPAHLQFILWCSSILLLVWGVSGLRWQAARQSMMGWWMAHRREIAVVGLVTLLALVLRTWQLENAIRLFLDEGHFADGVRYFWLSDSTKLFKPLTGIIAFPFLYSYFQTSTVALLGRNLTALRAVSVVIGTFSIPALYWLAKQFFERRVAFLAALLLAVFPPHIHFSRMGINNIADTLFGVLAFVFLARGLKSGRRLDYALAGVLLGLTQYFYEGGRLLYPPLVVVWLLGMWGFRRGWQSFRRDIALGLLTMGCVVVIVAIPIYYTFYGLKFPIAARFEITSVLDIAGGDPTESALSSKLLERLHTSLQFYISIPEAERPRHYGGDTPLVLVYLVPALLLGVGYALIQIRSRGYLLFLLWVLLTTLGNMLMQWANLSARYVIVFPALMLLVSLGIACTVDALVPRWKNAVVVVLVAGLGVMQVGYYFGPHLRLYNAQLRPSYDSTDAMFRSVNFPIGTQIHFVSDPPIDGSYTKQAMQFLVDGTDLLVVTHLTPDYLNGLSRTVDQAFFITRTDADSLALLQATFLLEAPAFTPYDIPTDKQFVLYYARCSQGCTLQGH